MVRRRRGSSGTSDECLDKHGSGFRSPAHTRRSSPEYTPTVHPVKRALKALKQQSTDDSSSDSSSISSSASRRRGRAKKKSRKNRHGRSRSRSPSSDELTARRHITKKKKTEKKSKSSKNKHKRHHPSSSKGAAFAAPATAVQGRVVGGATNPGGASTAETDEPIVIFDRVSRVFTADARSAREDVGPPLGAPTNNQPQSRELANYRKAFGLSCGNYAFVSDTAALPAAASNAALAAAAVASAAGAPGGPLLTSSLDSTREKGGDREGNRVTPKTHPHLYWSCWKCSALNFKTRHQCHKCNRLFQR
ncbi:uncharacterized protein LOC34617820 [Cyclospora cayetanensis]|uniref:Uncharacterized protein n=2 Tax=Cyclospora cayetanensis TaxID=88456 RepID=A0A1D3CRA9_9EIME|nr:uncharacterized protein LOC34617820 [Cyclospora cayetanensis]OEH73730.1 hypothetical protein cyc_00691 [Cyclospora cayetanensis]